MEIKIRLDHTGEGEFLLHEACEFKKEIDGISISCTPCQETTPSTKSCPERTPLKDLLLALAISTLMWASLVLSWPFVPTEPLRLEATTAAMWLNRLHSVALRARNPDDFSLRSSA